MSSRSTNSINLKTTAQSLVAALIATLFVLTTPVASSASINHGAIAYNSGTCELAAAGYEGDGSPGNAYQISDSESLWEVADCSLTGSPQVAAFFNVIADIYPASASAGTPTTSPIGYSTSGPISFSGILIGAAPRLNGIAYITGLSISSSVGNAGLFVAFENARAESLRLFGQILTTHNGSSAGGLAGFATGENNLSIIINNASITAPRAANSHAGGILGKLYGEGQFYGLFNSGAIRSEDAGGLFGGIYGSNGDIQIDLAQNSGDVVGGMISSAGGLIGTIGSVGSTTVISGVSINNGDISAGLWTGGAIGLHVHASSTLDLIGFENFGSISNGSYAAGIIGQSFGSVSLSSVVNTGEVSASPTGIAAGLAAEVKGTLKVDASTNSGTVSSALKPAGGFAGSASQVVILNSANTGNIEGEDRVGGLVGEALVASISRSLNSGSILGADSVGGLIGYSSDAEVSNSTNSGRLSGNDFIGGILGFGVGSISMSHVLNTGDLYVRDWYGGGIVGRSMGVATLSNVANQGDVQGHSLGQGDFFGGVVGSAETLFVVDSSNAGFIDVNASSADYLGGIAGAILTQGQIQDSINNGGLLSAGRQLGGMVGFVGGSSQVTLSRVANHGFVESDKTDHSEIGGLVGTVNSNASLDIQDAYNLATVSGHVEVAGLVGLQQGTLTISSSFNAGTIEAVSSEDPIAFTPNGATTSYTSVYGIGFAQNQGDPLGTVSSLQARSTFVGWDFNNVWGFGTCSENSGFPTLRSLGLYANYYSNGCYTAPLSNAGSGGAPAAVYVGPIIASMSSEVVAGQLLEVEGRRLDSVATVSIAGLLQEIVSKSATRLVVLVSSSTTVGVADLILESSFGTLTVQQALNVLEPKVTHPLVGRTKVLAASKLAAENWVANNLSDSGLKRVVCTVLVASDATRAERVFARKSAKASCLAVSGYLDDPSVWFQTRVTAHQKLVGRTMLTFKG